GIGSRAEYARLHTDSERWLTAARAIAQKHGLPTRHLTRISEGSNIVFANGPYIIKIYPPYYRPLFEAEQCIAPPLYFKLPIPTPQVWTAGEVDGWPYLITSRLTGVYLSHVWDTMERKNQIALASALGEVLAALHALPTHSLRWLAPTWRSFIGDRWRDAVAHHQARGVAPHWLQQIPGFLASAAPLYLAGDEPVLLHNDLHQHHLLVTWHNDAWRLCGLFDFDDALPGYREYDFATPGLFMMARRADLLRAFLRAYGYADADLDPALSAR